LPSLSKDSENRPGKVVNESETPIMNGVYHFHEKEELITRYHTPFYKAGWDQNGSVTLEGRYYPKVHLIYNSSEDLLLLWSSHMRKAGEKSLLINQSKVDSFTVHNDKFLHYRHAKLGNSGFYKAVVRGQKIQCFAKETKSSQLAGTVNEFNEKSTYFIRYAGVIHTYRQVSSLYSIFPAHKSEVKSYLRANPSNRKDKASFLRSVLTFCDSIVK